MPVEPDDILLYHEAEVMPSVMEFTPADFAGAWRDATELLPGLEDAERADAAAYRCVIAAGRSREGAGRLREALSDAADIPLAVAEAGAVVSGLAARLAREGNPNLEGDAVCAVFLADAGVRAATALVKINLTAAGLEDARLSRAS